MSNMNEIIAMCIGLLTITIIFYLGPGIGQQVSTALPINESGDFANATTGASVWTSGASIVSVVVLVAFVTIIIRSLKGVGGNNNNQ